MSAPALTIQRQGQSSISADQLNTYVQSCDTITQLRGFIGIQGVQVFVRGIFAPDDGGAGNFWWDATGTAPDDGVNVIVPVGAGAGEWLRINISQPYDIAVNFQGLPAASQTFRYTASRLITFAANFGLTNFGQSIASCDVPATVQQTFNIYKAPVATPSIFTLIGTIVYPIGAYFAIISSVNGLAYSLSFADSLRIICPAIQDATLAGVAITLAGGRVG